MTLIPIAPVNGFWRARLLFFMFADICQLVSGSGYRFAGKYQFTDRLTRLQIPVCCGD